MPMRYLIPIAFLILPCFPGLAAPLPDPTRPADYAPRRPVDSPAAKEMEWKVNGITISPRGNSAIVNGQVVTAGDQIASATVLEILPTGVVLDFEGRRVTVGFLPQTVKSVTSRRILKDSIEWSGI